VTLFLIGLPFGRQMGWTAQQRDSEGVPFIFALSRLWPHLIAGFAFAVSLYLLAPGALWLAAPFYTGLAAATILTVVSGSPRVGAWARDAGLCRLPEEAPRVLTPDALATLLASPPPAATK
ncbi:MAG: glucans biosynthesis glucosyltransferase MdoH, partial [Betaproteobacteria bacterium]